MAQSKEETATVAHGPTVSQVHTHAELGVLAQQLTELHDVEVAKLARGDHNEVAVLILPQGRRAVDVTPFLESQRENPKRIRGRAKLATPESFVAHVKRFKSEASVIFADVLAEQPKLLARYDYHEPGKPAWQEHTAQYDFPKSPEWKAWCAHDGEKNMMTMEAFAFFLEQRVVDVLHPSGVENPDIKKMQTLLEIDWATPQQLLQLSKTLHIKTESKLMQITDVQGGRKNFAFEETDKDQEGKPLVLPGGFLIEVAVFEGSAPWLIPVLLRYRKVSGRAQFFYEIYRRDQHVLESMRDTCAKVAKDAGLPLLFGKPERSLGTFTGSEDDK